MRSLFLGGLVAVSALGAAVAVGCGDSGETGGAGGDTGTGGAGTTSSVTVTSTGTGSSSTGGIPTDCTEVTAGEFFRGQPDFYAAYINGSDEDIAAIEFYDAVSGTVTLGTGIDENYATCTSCVMAYTADASFFAVSGTLTLGANGSAAPEGAITDATLVEVTIDEGTFESTPVAGGSCYHITNAPLDFDLAPETWTCDPAYFGDKFYCDCEDCGVVDPDCANDALETTCGVGIACEADGVTCEGAGGGGQGGGGGAGGGN